MPTDYVCKSCMNSNSSKYTENDAKSPIKKSVKDKRLRMFKEPSLLDSHVVAKEAEGRIKNIIQKMLCNQITGNIHFLVSEHKIRSFPNYRNFVKPHNIEK